jgi:hypothetical protein
MQALPSQRQPAGQFALVEHKKPHSRVPARQVAAFPSADGGHCVTPGVQLRVQ